MRAWWKPMRAWCYCNVRFLWTVIVMVKPWWIQLLSFSQKFLRQLCPLYWTWNSPSWGIYNLWAPHVRMTSHWSKSAAQKRGFIGHCSLQTQLTKHVVTINRRWTIQTSEWLSVMTQATVIAIMQHWWVPLIFWCLVLYNKFLIICFRISHMTSSGPQVIILTIDVQFSPPTVGRCTKRITHLNSRFLPITLLKFKFLHLKGRSLLIWGFHDTCGYGVTNATGQELCLLHLSHGNSWEYDMR